MAQRGPQNTVQLREGFGRAQDAWGGEVKEAGEELFRPYWCDRVTTGGHGEGRARGRPFPKHAALSGHRRETRSARPLEASVIVTNQCLCREGDFADRRAAMSRAAGAAHHRGGRHSD
eukprot:1535788-Pyramimonas_sp.AAC.1